MITVHDALYYDTYAMCDCVCLFSSETQHESSRKSSSFISLGLVYPLPPPNQQPALIVIILLCISLLQYTMLTINYHSTIII